MEELLRRYPKTVAGRFQVRPLEAVDRDALEAFFTRIPPYERELFADDVTRAPVVRGWIRDLDYAVVLPLVAFDGPRIVADATLHRDNRGWFRHVGRIRIALDPESRLQGLARALVREFAQLAGPLGVALLEAQVLDVQADGQRLFEDMGFLRATTLPGHAVDQAGGVHDVHVYTLQVTPEGDWTGPAAWTGDEADIGRV
ncbi:MAG TPA: GNAT family N-acetyltransferase [Planctomycetota bacterium]|nr:GNAT family N-acetyltransferase [Planctomycetota bacterium]